MKDKKEKKETTDTSDVMTGWEGLSFIDMKLTILSGIMQAIDLSGHELVHLDYNIKAGHRKTITIEVEELPKEDKTAGLVQAIASL